MARAVNVALSPATTVSDAGATVTLTMFARTVTSTVELSPHADAVIRTVPARTARTTPLSSTVATVLSDDLNSIGTSERGAPKRLVANALTTTVSVARAGE